MLLTKKKTTNKLMRWWGGLLFCFVSWILHFEIGQDVQDSGNAGTYK